MAYQSRLELIVDSQTGEQSLRRFERRLDQLEKSGDRADGSISRMGSSMGRIASLARVAGGGLIGLAAGGAAFVTMSRQASRAAAEIQNLANLSNTTAQEFQKISYASAGFGVEQEKLADILKDVNDRVGEFLQTGSGEMSDFFDNIAPKVGVTADQFARLSGPQALQLYYQSLEDAGLSQQEMMFYMESMADEASALIPLLRDNGAELNRLTGEADRLNTVLSDMEIQRLRDIRGEFTQLEQQLSTETMRAVSQFDELMKSSLEGISQGINQVARGFNVFMDSFRDNEAKRSIAGIDAELTALFDTRDRLQQRIDMFGEDSEQARDSISALQDLRAEYTTLIDRKKELEQAALPVAEPEVLQLNRANAGFKTLNEWLFELPKSANETTLATAEAVDTVDDLADAYESLLDRITPNRREARQYARDLGVLNLALASGRMTTTQYMQAMGMLQESFQAAQRDSDDLSNAVTDGTDEMTRQMERFGNSVDDAFVDAFRGAFDSFEDFADRIGDAFENLMAELAYAALKNEIKIQLGMGTSGPMSGGLGQLFGGQGGGLGGIGSLVNGAKSLFGFGGGAANAGASLGGMPGGLSSAAITSANQVASGAGFMSSAAGLMKMAPQIAALYGIQQMGNNLLMQSGAYDALGIRTDGRSAQLGGQLLGPGGTVLGSALDAIGIGGQKSDPRLNISTRGDTGQFSHESVRTGAFGAVGFSEGTKRSNDLFGSVEQEREWLASVAALDNLTAAAARTPEQLDAMTAAVQNMVITSEDAQGAIDQLAGRTAAATSVIDSELTQSLIDAGATAEEIAQRFASASSTIDVISAASARLNLQYDAGAEGALRYADSLVQAFGSVENIAAIQDAYYNAAFSDQERLQHQFDDVRSALNGITDNAPRTVEELRTLVEAQNLNEAATGELAVRLMQLAPALEQTNAAVRQAIEQQYQDVLGRAPAAEGMGYWFDQVASGALTLEEALGAIANSAEAAQYAAGGAADAIDDVASVADTLAPVEAAWRALNKSVDDERQILENAYRETTASIERNMQTVQNGMQVTDRMASSLQSTLNEMMGASASGQQAQFETASGYLRSVLSSGGLGDPDELERALSAVANPSQDTYETLQDYQRDFLATANVVDQLRDRADEQLTTEERSLRALESQLSQADLQFDREMSALDATLETQRAQLEAQFGQLDWLSTLNGSVLSIADAISALDLAAAQASGSAAPSGGSSAATDPITKAYQDLLGRAPEASGYEYYASGGYSDAEIRSMIANSPEARGVPGFASGGYHMGGARIVGERGPELEVTGPSRIVSNTNTQKMFDLEPLLKEVAQLRRELAASQRAIAENTRKSARVLEREELERRQEEVA